MVTIHTADSVAAGVAACRLISSNVAPKPRMLSVRVDYVLRSLQLPSWVVKRDGARTLLISLSAPQLPGSARKNSEHD